MKTEYANACWERKDSAVTKTKSYALLSATGFPRGVPSLSLFCWAFCLLIKQMISNKWTVRKLNCRTAPHAQVTFDYPPCFPCKQPPPHSPPAVATGSCAWWDCLVGRITHSARDLLPEGRLLLEPAMPDYHFNNQNQSDLSGQRSPFYWGRFHLTACSTRPPYKQWQ